MQILNQTSDNSTKQQTKTGSTPFDDAFRTLLERAPALMVPLINEIFGEKFDYRTSVIQFKNEHVFLGRKVVTDSHLYVGELSVGGHHYHIECQSVEDGDIILRMAEYDFYIALEGLEEEAPHLYSIRLPHSAVLYLRGNGTVPEYELLKIYSRRGLDRA